ncbi:MAG: efflux RND transporter periplasmic adaptor subunit [Bacteroidales bacterium]
MSRLLIAVIITMITASCSSSENSKKQTNVVRTSVAKSMLDENRKSFSFITHTHHTANLSFRVGGPVSKFNVYSGNYFHKGDVIAEIDSRDFIIRQERSQTTYNQAKMEYERIKVLYEKNNISASSYDKVYADYISAKTAYETTTNELADTKLIAPFNGYIDRIFIDKFQEVKPTEPIISFVNIDTIRVEVPVSQDIALKASKIKSVNVIFDAIPDSTFRAKVVEVSKNTTSNNLSYLLTALLPNRDLSLLPGMSGSLVFEDMSPKTIITVPQSALSTRPTVGEFLWCVNDGTVTQRVVKSGRLMPNGQVEIVEGLESGEVVAVSGVRFLSEGSCVEVVK